VTELAERSIVDEARIHDELDILRETILQEGTEAFMRIAMTENDNVLQQRCTPVIDTSGFSFEESLRELEVNEVSPILKEESNHTFSIFLRTDDVWSNRVYFSISKMFLSPRVDFDTYDMNCAAAREKLETLKTLLEEGASMAALAEEHSDNFDWTQGDISKTYQTGNGFAFAREINSIPDGGLKIIRSKKGFHLVQVLSRVTTPYTEEIKESIIQQYNDELAQQNDRYVVTKKLFYEVNPYFK